MTDFEMIEVKCANCGKELLAPKQIEQSKIVCNPSCYYALVRTFEANIFEVEFCEQISWECLVTEQKKENP
jgi:DNA-directed RNA polymerase subunit RPC12/RpoP